MAERKLSAADVSSAVRKFAELNGGRIGKYQLDDILHIPKQPWKLITRMLKERWEKPKKEGDRIEAEVGKYIRETLKLDLTDFANEIKNEEGIIIGDIDCATENVFIEVKTKAGDVKIEQIRKYIDINHEKFMNVKQKRVVLYIKDSIKELSGEDAEKIRKVKEMGVRVVNDQEELKEVMELWEHPGVS